MSTTSALLFDPTDPGLGRDPYPASRRMREESPAWRSPEGIWYFTRYQDCIDRHLSIGVGHHLCIGAALARLEAAIALRRLFERLPALALASDEEPEYRPNLQLRGFSKLPVSIG